MPKLKTNRSAAKRFYRTGGGKLMRRRACKSHLLEHKSAKRRRRLGQPTYVSKAERKRVSRLVPHL